MIIFFFGGTGIVVIAFLALIFGYGLIDSLQGMLPGIAISIFVIEVIASTGIIIYKAISRDSFRNRLWEVTKAILSSVLCLFFSYGFMHTFIGIEATDGLFETLMEGIAQFFNFLLWAALMYIWGMSNTYEKNSNWYFIGEVLLVGFYAWLTLS